MWLQPIVLTTQIKAHKGLKPPCFMLDYFGLRPRNDNFTITNFYKKQRT